MIRTTIGRDRHPSSLLSIVLAATLGGLAMAEGVSVTYSIGSLPEQQIELQYVGQFLGAARYVSTVVVDGVTLTWDYRVKADTLGNRVLNGTTVVLNQGAGTIALASRAQTMICPALIGDTKVGGQVGLGLYTNEGGGCLTCVAGAAGGGAASIAELRGADGIAWARPSFYCPVALCFTGGQGESSDTWGNPFPSLVGPDAVQSMAHTVSVAISAGDKAKVALLLVVHGEPESSVVPGCAGDTNGDGIVDGADLAEVFNQWGPVGCEQPVDANEDGWVDGGDLAIVFSAWGDCTVDPPSN